jgi:hypothetical protein
MANTYILHVPSIPLLLPQWGQSTAVYGVYLHGRHFFSEKKMASNSPQAWLWVEKFPTRGNQNLFAFDVDSTRQISLEIHPDGKLSFKSTAQEGPGLFPHARIMKARWTHVALVHYTHRSPNPTIRLCCPLHHLKPTKSHSGLFIDGIPCDGLNWSYPKSLTNVTHASYVLGDDTPDATMQWCLSTSYLVSTPLGQCHHLPLAISADITPKTTSYTVSYIT